MILFYSTLIYPIHSKMYPMFQNGCSRSSTHPFSEHDSVPEWVLISHLGVLLGQGCSRTVNTVLKRWCIAGEGGVFWGHARF